MIVSVRRSPQPFRRYVAIIWRWFWLIGLCTLLAGGTALAISYNSTPIYEASATLLIYNDYTPIFTDGRLARTYAELLKMRPVLEQVIERLSLPMEPIELVKDITVQPILDTQLIRLKVKNPNPELAARIANTLPEVFIEHNQRIQTSRFASSEENLAREIEILQQDIAHAREAINRLGTPQTPAQQVELDRLQNNLTQYRASYLNLLSSYEGIRLSEAQLVNNVVVSEPADVPIYPVRPRTLLNTLLAAIMGAILASGSVFLIEYLDDTIKTPEEVLRVLNLPTLGAIARFDDKGQQLIAHTSPKSPIAEAYRTLCINIQFSSVDRPVRTLLITSSGPREGKSTIAANLAIVMAQTGQMVVLVDTDLRRPTLHKLFHLPNAVGLTTALFSDTNLMPDGYVQPTEVENLYVFTSGPLPPNPLELLGSQRMQELIQRLQQEADLLIFDSPPVLAVTDAAVLARQLDGVLLVIDAEETRQPIAQQACEELSKVGARILGVALNKLTAGRSGYYSYELG
ncbi:MAG: polysaccharide biosynthesis tyrosine autokinase [Anaerolineae bacterium]|nr:polysaccharide biosynthesis tyrosine autokinase [Anaerolineae bacterium]MDW8099156.1 polysaccharide biosynthesis tyrosine autokinase [Anaerolineae bacterium]